MYRKLLCSVLFAWFVLSGRDASCGFDAKDIYKNASSSVVLVKSYDKDGEPIGIGSGFFSFDGFSIVTNAHVVSGASRVVCKLSDEIEIDIKKLSYFNADEDIAILVSPKKGNPLVLDDKVEVGEEVFVIGNPLGLERTITTGIVSGKRSIASNRLIQITAPISPGNSGGPVLSSDCKVVGVTTFLLKGGQNLNFAVEYSLINKASANRKEVWLKDLATMKRGVDKAELPVLKLPVAMEMVFGNFNIAHNLSLWKTSEMWHGDDWVDMKKHNGNSVVYPSGLSKTVEGGRDKYVLFFKVAPYIGFDYGRGSAPYIGYVVFDHADSGWKIDHYKLAFEKIGNYGSAPDPVPCKPGPNSSGFYFEWDSSHQGSEFSKVYIYTYNDGNPVCVFSFQNKEGFNGGVNLPWLVPFES